MELGRTVTHPQKPLARSFVEPVDVGVSPPLYIQFAVARTNYKKSTNACTTAPTFTPSSIGSCENTLPRGIDIIAGRARPIGPNRTKKSDQEIGPLA